MEYVHNRVIYCYSVGLLFLASVGWHAVDFAFFPNIVLSSFSKEVTPPNILIMLKFQNYKSEFRVGVIEHDCTKVENVKTFCKVLMKHSNITL